MLGRWIDREELHVVSRFAWEAVCRVCEFGNVIAYTFSEFYSLLVVLFLLFLFLNCCNISLVITERMLRACKKFRLGIYYKLKSLKNLSASAETLVTR